MAANTQPPKVFISYSWTNDEHQDRVVELAERLSNDGVNVVVDVWNLKEGHDKYSFMESMVTDASIKRVLMILDKGYAEKADARKGGVGSESQIISAELYGKVDQDKFVPIIFQRDEQRNPYTPVFLKSRIYVDLSSREGYATEYEKLLRNIYEKPARQRPAIGPPPDFLDSANPASPATKFRLEAFSTSIQKGGPESLGNLKRFFTECVSALESFRITGDSELSIDERVIQRIQEMKGLRDQLIEAFELVCDYGEDRRFYSVIHGFFEGSAQYLFRPKGLTGWSDVWFDQYRFFLRELFLYLIAILLKHERYDEIKYFTETDYRYTNGGEPELGSYILFDQQAGSLDGTRNQRLKLNRLSVTADVVKERADRPRTSFDELIQADVVLALRFLLPNPTPINAGHWYPATGVFKERLSGPLPLFLRIKAGRDEPAALALFGDGTPAGLKLLLANATEKHDLKRWRFGHWPMPFAMWMGLT